MAKAEKKGKVIAEPVRNLGDEIVAAILATEQPPVVESVAPPKVKHPDEDVVLMPKYVPTYSPYGGNGEYAADHRLDKDRAIYIGGERYEHCSETPDGRWVYRKG